MPNCPATSAIPDVGATLASVLADDYPKRFYVVYTVEGPYKKDLRGDHDKTSKEILDFEIQNRCTPCE
jgi:hypothetical protein